MNRRDTTVQRPVGLSICWEPKPDTPARCCTIKDPHHPGDHEHEYSGATWPRTDGRQ
jgi:hypothetical protein